MLMMMVMVMQMLILVMEVLLAMMVATAMLVKEESANSDGEADERFGFDADCLGSVQTPNSEAEIPKTDTLSTPGPTPRVLSPNFNILPEQYPFAPFSFGPPLLKPKRRNKGACIIKGLLRNLVKSPIPTLNP